MNPILKRRITYAGVIGSLAVCLSIGTFQHLLYLLIGMIVSFLIRVLWNTRTFTIGINDEGQLFTACELCQDTEVVLTGAGLRTTIGFAFGHARQHITRKI